MDIIVTKMKNLAVVQCLIALNNLNIYSSFIDFISIRNNNEIICFISFYGKIPLKRKL